MKLKSKVVLHLHLFMVIATVGIYRLKLVEQVQRMIHTQPLLSSASMLISLIRNNWIITKIKFQHENECNNYASNIIAFVVYCHKKYVFLISSISVVGKTIMA